MALVFFVISVYSRFSKYQRQKWNDLKKYLSGDLNLKAFWKLTMYA